MYAAAPTIRPAPHSSWFIPALLVWVGACYFISPIHSDLSFYYRAVRAETRRKAYKQFLGLLYTYRSLGCGCLAIFCYILLLVAPKFAWRNKNARAFCRAQCCFFTRENFENVSKTRSCKIIILCKLVSLFWMIFFKVFCSWIISVIIPSYKLNGIWVVWKLNKNYSFALDFLKKSAVNIRKSPDGFFKFHTTIISHRNTASSYFGFSEQQMYIQTNPSHGNVKTHFTITMN